MLPLMLVCDCRACTLERHGQQSLSAPVMWCAACGHAHADLRRPGVDDGSRMGCAKCKTQGQWSDTDPKPPIREGV